MHSDVPYALFITWTVYGTHLVGDVRGWRDRTRGFQVGCMPLEQWHRSRLNHDVLLLTGPMRHQTAAAIHDRCDRRRWTLWACSVRANHVHVVVSAARHSPANVRDQLKARATEWLRKRFVVFVDRPVWTAKGDITFLDDERDVEACVRYCEIAQDRKARDQ